MLRRACVHGGFGVAGEINHDREARARAVTAARTAARGRAGRYRTNVLPSGSRRCPCLPVVCVATSSPLRCCRQSMIGPATAPGVPHGRRASRPDGQPTPRGGPTTDFAKTTVCPLSRKWCRGASAGVRPPKCSNAAMSRRCARCSSRPTPAIGNPPAGCDSVPASATTIRLARRRREGQPLLTRVQESQAPAVKCAPPRAPDDIRDRARAPAGKVPCVSAPPARVRRWRSAAPPRRAAAA